MLVVRQTRALGKMLWRFWLRRGIVGRRGAGAVRAPGVAARGLLILLFGSIGYAEGGLSRSNPRAIALFTLGLFGYAWAVMASTAIVTVRGIIAPLDARFLDELPLREQARVVARVFGQPQLFALAITGVHAASAAPSLLRDASFGSFVAFAAMVSGLASSHVVRVFLSPMRIARMTVPLLVAGISAFLLIAEAPFVAQAAWGARIADAIWPLVRGLVARGSGWTQAGGLLAVVVASGLAIAWAERAGFDRVDAVPTKRYRRASPGDLTLGRVDRVLAAREPGARFVWVGALYVTLCVVGVYGARASGAETGSLVRGVLLIAAFLGFSGASARAARMAERDLVARALLAPLPIVPGDLLAGKMAPIRRQAMTVVAPLLFLPFAGAVGGERVDAAWHVGAVIASVWIASGALASVAFLTSGAGGGPRAAMNAPLNLERLLVLVPMLAVAYAPTFWIAAMQLIALGLLAYEARRAARVSVRWLDDQEDFTRETSVWRALLVLSAFVALTSFATRILSVFHLDPVTTTSLVYLVSAAALVVLTVQERGGLTAIPLWPAGQLFGVLGVTYGLVMGVFVLVYARFIARLGFVPPDMTEARGSAVAAAAFVFAAPLAEELFFRGWLLEAIGREYAGRGGAFAIVMTAFAFASISPPVNLIPALLFGLVAGSLARRSGAIGPGVVAHAIVNAMTLFFMG